ncbi:MAG: tRNA lysidine(34) synthetase TilS, partial [Pseudomonadota bacterium]|nr:tRNA lysidine(34) synthetase TilS [Pseudomonadota bacterium]
LYVPYTELVEYALANQLQWIEDSSNMDLNFSRNQVRHQLLPAFEQACSNIQQQIQRSALHQSEALQLLKRLAQQDLNSGVYSELYIDLDSYRVLDWPSLKNVLRFWAEDQFKLRLGYDQLEWIKRYSRDNPSASASLKLSQGQLRFYRTKLYYVTDNKNDYQLKLDEVQPCSISASDIRAKRDFRVLLPLDWYEANRTKLTLRNIKHADHGNSKRLKKWFQQQGVPVWERLHWPVLYMNDLPLTLWGAAGIFENNVSTQLEKLISERQESHEFICFHLTESEIVSLSSELK